MYMFTCMLHTYTWTCFKAPVASLFNIVRANVYVHSLGKKIFLEKKIFYNLYQRVKELVIVGSGVRITDNETPSTT